MELLHHVYLIPGFFGFANFGEFSYFSHVAELLASRLVRHRLDVALHVVKSPPTASIRRRALELYRAIAGTAAGGEGPIHLIGHSTGGLDARLLVSPGVSLPGVDEAQVERFARRVCTVIGVATPHHGTPMASFFNTLLGQKLLQLVSLATIYVLRFGRLPISFLLPLAGVLSGLDDVLYRRQDTLDQLYDQLLRDFSPERRDALQHFFQQVSTDQSLLPQLTPEGIDLFNATARPRPGVRYGSVVTQARRPGLKTALAAGVGLYPQVNHALYLACHRLVALTPSAFCPRVSEEQSRALRLGYGRFPEIDGNDGMVPTLSQVWGPIIAAAWADHLDVIGHFDNPLHDPPHFDWLVTGTRFQRWDFEEMWAKVARFIAEQRSSRVEPEDPVARPPVNEGDN
ncbi:MAG: triacylglycerol lipase [Deltaproteobacteria bacterium]|nr:triacylglycerol lipase [Deltaproteobacteria bacterium]